ncbi:hypothetical protein [Allorhodopirellula heiligendammensis]|uniref:Uncharacterized protein n=1 Tax=Allorhodopirellula heiligendammensis TaxID=2714739 RepID=A0A5C6BTC8_9BACT|nr:hypothetical protein [Allorhodopirellula heiligendammensis]TWU15265.1 hypothetical protein Poly21_24600 [Allorhodopirellula heiligendammensis]|tara:strand:- start:103 stop:708 length:606 start_codon:yes stop_codon:yes gene_type:complete
MATVFTGSSPTQAAGGHDSQIDHNQTIHWFVNAAFLQEIKDSNPHLWHEVHRLRTLCEPESLDLDKPQTSLREFIDCLDGLRDLIALQFALEESYGLISANSATALSTAAQQSIAEQNEAEQERQQMVRNVTDQHRKLYLQLIDLVELAEELQYRGCEAHGLRTLVQSAERFSADLTAHERLEAELIRLHDSRARTGSTHD